MANAYGISNGVGPLQGPKALRANIDLSAALSIDFDLVTEQTSDDLSLVQSMMIDNRNNPNKLQVDINGVPFSFAAPANSQGIYPVFCGTNFRCKFTTVALFASVIPVIFLNVPMPLIVWYP